MNVNSPASKQGNLVRMSGYLLGYMLVFMFQRILSRQKTISPLWELLFFVLAAVVTFFSIYRYNREERFFDKDEDKVSLVNDLKVTALFTVIILGLRVFIAWKQSSGSLPDYSLAAVYQAHASNQMFWFQIISQGLILSALQAYLSVGFFFNYAFRTGGKLAAIAGLLCSGLFFAILNWQFIPALFLANAIVGAFIAWSFLYTRNFLVAIYLSLLNGLIFVIFLPML